MRITSGTVVSGKIVVDDDELPEGTTVTIVAPNETESFILSAADEANLLEAIQDAEAGRTVPGSEVPAKISNLEVPENGETTHHKKASRYGRFEDTE